MRAPPWFISYALSSAVDDTELTQPCHQTPVCIPPRPRLTQHRTPHFSLSLSLNSAFSFRWSRAAPFLKLGFFSLRNVRKTVFSKFWAESESPDPMETSIEKLMDVPEHEERKEDFKQAEMGEEEVIDEMIVEGTKIGAEHEEDEINAEEVKSEEKGAAYKTYTKGPVVIPECEKEDGTNETMSEGCVQNHSNNETDKECVGEVPDEGKDSLIHGTQKDLKSEEVTGAEERMVVSESEKNEEIRVINMANETARVANQINTNVQMSDIAGKKKVKKSKNFRRKLVLQRVKLATQNEGKPKSSVANQSADKHRPGGKEEVTEEQDVKNMEETKSNNKGKRLRKRRRLKVKKGEGNKGSAEDKGKAETSMTKSKKKAESMGMIFMCSSKTKQDCYRYKVMGLPASKKDMVLKVYKGMRIFLFDFDLRLLYGIYKAAGPGGYNIEPRAFKSEFPSQVRFSVLEDCFPLAEEKFKTIIKDNYYGKNKFHCELSSEQVKNLCKLFKTASADKGRYSKPQGTGVASSSRKRDRKGRRAPVEVRRDHVAMDNGYPRWARDEVSRGRAIVDAAGYNRRPLAYETEDFVPAVAAPFALAPPIPSAPTRGLPYVYGTALGPDAYRRETAYEQRGHSLASAFDVYRHSTALEHHDMRLPGLEVGRLQDVPELHEPYASYLKSLAAREPVFSAGLQGNYDYYSQVGPSVEHRPLAEQNAAYNALGTFYRSFVESISTGTAPLIAVAKHESLVRVQNLKTAISLGSWCLSFKSVDTGKRKKKTKSEKKSGKGFGNIALDSEDGS
ncbi:hypothetical protein Nepgr_014114 [Nepenthes gracilis]|uniref:DCD domain-containing protein n=1 Tax=Nepenthes gracilis TaxID=150966 RepID=A0AAD3SIW5_NEPGR|nr:hypothetical protein Nepgr_014114 [Nepenthes gracilis]